MEHFNELAHKWENPERIERAARLAQKIRQTWGTDAPRTLFDFGSGTGLLSLHFLGELDALYAYDPSEGMRAVLAQKLALLPRDVQAKVRILSSMDEVPAGLTCESVLTSQVLHHIEDAAATVNELAALVAPGGSLTVIDFVAGNGFRHPGHHHHHDLPHHGFDPQQMAEWMTQAGLFDIESNIAYEGVHLSSEEEEEPYRLFLTIGHKPRQ